jgi:FkbM family methyltransferase
LIISTRVRVAGARLAYQGLNVARGPWRPKQVVVTRGGLRWNLDLREGIDLSIYLVGSFEPSVARTYRTSVRDGSTVVDVGANIGAHTLPLARAVGAGGRVLAFEPTTWAFDKLRANLALNPDIAGRVRAEQAMLVSEAGAAAPAEIYSSWPLVPGGDVHPEHRGRLMSTGPARSTTLDAYLAEEGVDQVDFIKLDVDGAEPEVLAGGQATISRSAPTIVMELAPYIYEGTDGFGRLVSFLRDHDYTVKHLRTGRALVLDAEALYRQIPSGSSMNVLCVRR